MLGVCTADPNADIPLGRVDIPIKEILREAARPSGQRLASAAKVAYKLRQAAQRARAAVEARRAADMLRYKCHPMLISNPNRHQKSCRICCCSRPCSASKQL